MYGHLINRALPQRKFVIAVVINENSIESAFSNRLLSERDRKTEPEKKEVEKFETVSPLSLRQFYEQTQKYTHLTE